MPKLLIFVILSLSLMASDKEVDEKIKTVEEALLEAAGLINKLYVQIEKLDEKDNVVEKKELKLKDFFLVSKISSNELMHLLENGIVKTKTQYLIKLRTGETYGDILSLNEKIYIVIDTAQKEGLIETNNSSLLNLLASPHRKHLIPLFESSNIHWENIIHDAKNLEKIKEYLIFFNAVNTYTWHSIGNGGRLPTIDTVSSLNTTFNPTFLAAELIGNFYIQQNDSSLKSVLALNPYALGYSGSINSYQNNVGWWSYYTDGYLGAGISYTPVFGNRFGTWNLALGGFHDDQNDKINFSLAFQSLLGKNFLFGPNLSVNISHNHQVKYLGKYPIDGKIGSIRGLHRIEILEKNERMIRAGLIGNLFIGATNISSAFIASKGYTKRRIFRTFTDLAQKIEFVPSFDHPERFKEGEELLEKKTGILSGAFILGLQSPVPVYSLLLGSSVDIVGEFELSLKRLSEYKFEVSIELARLLECSLFQNLLTSLYSSKVRGLALAKKQSYLFDFSSEQARKAYFDLVWYGKLPGQMEIPTYKFERAPEYLISQFRKYNNELTKKGIRLIYIEQVNVSTKKFLAIIAPQIIPAILKIINKTGKNYVFEGFGQENIKATSYSVATNGIIAVSRETCAKVNTKRQGKSGKLQKDLVIIHKRIHTIEELENHLLENKYVFDSLIINAKISDTVITKNEDNKIINKLNQYFSTYIPNKLTKNSKEPRLVSLERVITRFDLEFLSNKILEEKILLAAATSKLPFDEILQFLNQLKNHHPDEQASMIKHFIKSAKGMRGFSCIHQLLGARPEDLIIKVSSGYQKVIEEAQSFVAKSFDVNLEAKYVKKIYKKSLEIFSKIDTQLKILLDDPYFLDEKFGVYDEDKKKKLIQSGLRQSKQEIRESLGKAKDFILVMLKGLILKLDKRIEIRQKIKALVSSRSGQNT